MSPEPATVRDLRRGQIVAASRTIIARDGLDALTFAALERELGYTRGVVTWHFRNKDEILRAVLDETVDDIDRVAMAAVAAEERIEDRVRAVVREMVRGWLGADAGPVLIAFWGRANADASEVTTSLYRGYRQQSADLVRLGQERGVFRRDVAPDRAAATLVGLVVGVAVQSLFEPGGLPDLDGVVASAGDAVVAWLTGSVAQPTIDANAPSSTFAPQNSTPSRSSGAGR